MNRLNKYAGMWESQERAMRSAPYARTVEWDINTSPPMQWHFGPPPAGWGSYLSGSGLNGLGLVGDESTLFNARTGFDNQYTTKVTPYNIPSSVAPGVPAIVAEEVRVEFAGASGGFTPSARWGSGADAGKIVLIFATARDATLTPSQIGEKLDAAIVRAQGRLAVGQQLLLPGRAPVRTASDASLTAADVQQELIRAGYNVGPRGADNDFGDATDRALMAAFGEIGRAPEYVATRRTVTMPVALWAALRALPSRLANSMGPAASGGGRATTGGGTTTSEDTSTGGSSGGGMGIVLLAAVGVGAYFLMRRRG